MALLALLAPLRLASLRHIGVCASGRLEINRYKYLSYTIDMARHKCYNRLNENKYHLVYFYDYKMIKLSILKDTERWFPCMKVSNAMKIKKWLHPCF